MARYTVSAIAVDEHGVVIAGTPRDEEIDTETNELFADCKGPWDVEDAYHAYWNRLNPHWEHDWPKRKEKVLVTRVVPA